MKLKSAKQIVTKVFKQIKMMVWSNSILGKAFTLYMANLNLIPGTSERFTSGVRTQTEREG